MLMFKVGDSVQSRRVVGDMTSLLQLGMGLVGR